MRNFQPVVVVHADGVMPEPPGSERRHFIDPGGRWAGWAGWIQNEAGDASGWHHHGANATYVYVIRGSVRTHFGAGGAESIEAKAGDFFIVPPHTIHRETSSQHSDVEAFIVRMGGEPEHVNVDGPDQ
jgi:uncharacterized RmlC-like cupin family protein